MQADPKAARYVPNAGHSGRGQLLDLQLQTHDQRLVIGLLSTRRGGLLRRRSRWHHLENHDHQRIGLELVRWLLYPGIRPREIKGGSAATYNEARAAFKIAWLKFAHQRDFTAFKYRMHDLGLPLPTQSDTGRARCFCGAEITTAWWLNTSAPLIAKCPDIGHLISALLKSTEQPDVTLMVDGPQSISTASETSTAASWPARSPVAP